MIATNWNKFTLVYTFICIIHLLVIQSVDYAYLNVFTKPLIMLSIIVLTIQFLKQYKHYKLILLSFVASLFGDVFLLWQARSDLFFLAGLASFLIAHLLYANYFYKSSNKTWNKNPKALVSQFLMILLVIGFYSLIYPGLVDLSIPVLFYVSTIGVMGILALNRYSHCNNASFWYILIGALSFIVSDSLIGFNKFVEPIANASVYIMLFYCLAQYLILKGFVLGEENELK